MVDFSELIRASAEWTITVLFRPFSPKKWIILGFVALLAGYLTGGGGHGHFGGSRSKEKSRISQAEAAVETVTKTPSSQSSQQRSFDVEKIRITFLRWMQNPFYVFIGAAILFLLLVFLVLITWLFSRFAFVFLENVIKNDASIKMPFMNNTKEADSYFGLCLIVMIVSLSVFISLAGLCWSALARLGIFDKVHHATFKEVFLTCLPYGLILLVLIILSAVFNCIFHEFVPVAMYREKIKSTKALSKILSLLNVHKGATIAYLFIKLGLSICASIIIGLFSMAVTFGLMLPGIPIILLGTGLYRIIPNFLHLPYLILVGVAGAILFIIMSYCFMLFYLPAAVFFRTFSVKFLGRLDPHYNLFVVQ